MLHHHDRPNVLLIITDQQRADAVGYETPWVHTPHLNALAQQSVVCSRAFVQSPQCQPSRASIFTGRYPTAHRVWWNDIHIPKSEVTLGNYLRDAGYHTGYFGKLHFDGADGHAKVASHFGFDETFLFEDWQKSLSMQFDKSSGRIQDEFFRVMMTKTWTGRLAEREIHHEEVVTHKAESFIKSAQRPFLCVVGFHGPHPPYASPDLFSGLYSRDGMLVPKQAIANQNGYVMSAQEWRELKAQYYGSVSWIDDCVGRLLAAVGPETIVVFTSDHGDILGDHGLFSKGMFAFDGNVRVPLLMRLPDVKSVVYRHSVQSIDILPTVLEACGVQVSAAVQGKSLLRAVADDRYVNDVVLSMIGHKLRLRMVRTLHHKYWLCGDEEHLFDLREDPDEQVNLSSSSSYLAQLRLLLAKGLIRAEDPLPLPL